MEQKGKSENLTGAAPRYNAAFGQGIGPVLLANVMCNGSENRLLDCPNAGLEVISCSHTADAGVSCVSGKIKW